VPVGFSAGSLVVGVRIAVAVADEQGMDVKLTEREGLVSKAIIL